MKFSTVNTSLTNPSGLPSGVFHGVLAGRGSQTATNPAVMTLTLNGQPNRHLVPDSVGVLTFDIQGALFAEGTATNATVRAFSGRVVARVSALNSTATDAITFETQVLESATNATYNLLTFGPNQLGTATNATQTVLANSIVVATATASNAFSLILDHVPAVSAGAIAPGYIRLRLNAQNNTTAGQAGENQTYVASFHVNGTQTNIGSGSW